MSKMCKDEKQAYDRHSSPQRGGSTLQVTNPDPSDEKDWEIINHSDLAEPRCDDNNGKSGIFAAGSLKIGRGEKKKEVFSFHFSTHGKCDACARKNERNVEEDEETVVGEEDGVDRKGGFEGGEKEIAMDEKRWERA